MVTQSRNGSQLLEKAIGDIWNQSGDTILTNSPLQIPNLARAIGEMRYLNPALYQLTDTFTFTENPGAFWPGQTDALLTFKPDSAPTPDGGSNNLLNLKAAFHEVQEAGDWYVDTNTGRLKTASPLDNTDIITYTVDTSTWIYTSEVRPNIIPDPRQDAFLACRVSSSGGSFYLHLPPRRPITFGDSAQDYPYRYPNPGQHSLNVATVTGAPYKIWQSAAVNALPDTFYRYPWPKEIEDALGGLSVGDSLPAGFLYLWDQDENTIIEDVVFKKTATDYIVEISSESVDFTSKVTASETEANYTGTGYSIITVGSSLTRHAFTLQKLILGGEYNNSDFLLPDLFHQNLVGVNPPTGTASAHDSRYPSNIPTWGRSRWAQDDHTYLLSREGSQGDDDTQRDPNDNAMLGDLVMASEVSSGGNYLNYNNPSRAIYFYKNNDTSPHIYSTASGEIQISSSDVNISRVEKQTPSRSTQTTFFGSGYTAGTTRYFKYSVFIDGTEYVDSTVYSITATSNGYGFSFGVGGTWWADSTRIYESTSTNFTGATYYTTTSVLDENDLVSPSPSGTATPSSNVLTQEMYPPIMHLDRDLTGRSNFYNALDIYTPFVGGISTTVQPAADYPAFRMEPNTLTNVGCAVSGDITAGSIFHLGYPSHAGHIYISDGAYWNKVVTRNFPTYGAEILLETQFSLAGTNVVSSTASEKAFPKNGTISSIAGWNIGVAYRIRCSIVTTAHNASDTLTVRIRSGTPASGTVLFSSGAITPAVRDRIIFDVFIQNIDGTNYVGSGFGAVATSIAAGPPQTNTIVSAASASDICRPLVFQGSITGSIFQITAQWSSSNAGNSCTMESIIVEKV